MASHNDLGSKGEEMAVEWLVANGFYILHRNWRHKYYEIDIIASKQNTLHIIEVKARNYSRFGNPEDSVTRKKFSNLKRATDEFLFLNGNKNKWLEYGILAITIFDEREPEFFFLRDVYL